MIRTRDIFIFAAILFFLGVGIAWTISRDITFSHRDIPFIDYVWSDASTTPFEAVRDDASRDRQSFIEHLRNALATIDTGIVPQPSVEEEGTPTMGSETPEDTSAEQGGALQSCGGIDDASNAIRNWPLSGVTLQAAGAVRQVVYVQEEAEALEPAAPKILMQVPLFPSKTAASCIGSDVIGVSVTGSLMYNNEASFYKGFGSEYLIGYARDGFPIYGYYEGAVDACGGYDHSAGYRYTVTPEKGYLLNCYSGQPAKFLPI